MDAADRGGPHGPRLLEAQYGLEPGTFGGTFEAFIERIHPDDRTAVREDTIEAAMTSGADFSYQNRYHPARRRRPVAEWRGPLPAWRRW